MMCWRLLVWELPAASGTTDYNNLTNKPSINDVTLEGNKTTEDLKISVGG